MPKEASQPVFSEASENRQVKKDLTFTLVVNGVFIAILVGLYFWNQATGAVDNFFAQVLRF